MTNTENENGTQPVQEPARDERLQDPQGVCGQRLRPDGEEVNPQGVASAARLSHPQPVGSSRLVDLTSGLVHDDEGKFTERVDADAIFIGSLYPPDNKAVALLLAAGVQCNRIVHQHPVDPTYIVSVLLVDQREYLDAFKAVSLAEYIKREGGEPIDPIKTFVELRTERIKRERNGASPGGS